MKNFKASLSEAQTEIDMELKTQSYIGYVKRLGFTVKDSEWHSGGRGFIMIHVVGDANKKQLEGLLKIKGFHDIAVDFKYQHKDTMALTFNNV